MVSIPSSALAISTKDILFSTFLNIILFLPAQTHRCVVGILEDMDTTKEAVTHFFPWMATDESTIDKAMKKGANRAKTGTKQNNADVSGQKNYVERQIHDQ